MSSFSWERNKSQQQAADANNNGRDNEETRAWTGRSSTYFGGKRPRTDKKHYETVNKTFTVTGYQCKFYRDQERWSSTNAKQHMIMWNDDPNMLLDRLVG